MNEVQSDEEQGFNEKSMKIAHNLLYNFRLV